MVACLMPIANTYYNIYSKIILLLLLYIFPEHCFFPTIARDEFDNIIISYYYINKRRATADAYTYVSCVERLN